MDPNSDAISTEKLPALPKLVQNDPPINRRRRILGTLQNKLSKPEQPPEIKIPANVQGPDTAHKPKSQGKGDSKSTSKGEYAPSGSIAKSKNLYAGAPDRHGKVSWTAKYPDDLEKPPENADSAQYALLIRNKKCYDGRKMLEIDSLVVQSEHLKKVLSAVLKGYPGISTQLERVEFRQPFAPFVHRWERFAEARESESDPETKTHVELLWGVLQTELRDDIREKNDHVANGVVRFDNVWTIFEPGKLVVEQGTDGHQRVYKLKSGSFATNACGQKLYSLQCEYIDWDGEKFGYGSSTLNIPAFGGTISISKLPAVPFESHPENDRIRGTLVARGKKVAALSGYHFQAYEGIAIFQGRWGPVRYNVKSRVIIDTHAFSRFNPNLKIQLQNLYRDEVDGDQDSSDDLGSSIEQDYLEASNSDARSRSLTEEQYLLCTHELRGYSLKDKKWLRFDVESVKDVVWNEDAFESLVAPPEQKELILAFARSQANNKGGFDDVIEGKGRGIIMLLSGPPGVGKTLTAESVAEAMRVPLYSMSAGDLGDNTHQLEHALNNILEMNTKWNAVLLIDEADVFLEARSPTELARNQQVSIFLRLLEYYEGILFLTTNRIDNIDSAFESRIHLSLQYEELDAPSRRHVWETFLSRTTKSTPFSEKQLNELVDYQMNGRQIKNVLKTAQLLASEQGKNLDFGHINTVLKIRIANTRK
jgi:ATPase family associated with various cellular activities (AAA)